MDPLSLIRKFTVDGSAVMNDENGFYIFGSMKYHEKTETSFKRSLGSSDYYYTVKDVLFFMENMDASMQEYRKKVVSLRLTAITEADKQDLKDYVLGVTSSAKQIDPSKAASVVKEIEEATGGVQSASSMKAASGDQGGSAMDVEVPAASSKTATQAASSSSSGSGTSSGKAGSSSKSKSGEGRKSVSRMKRSREAAGGEFDLSKENVASDLKKIAAAKHGDVPVADRCTVLRATSIGQDPFKFALNLFNQHILKKMDDVRKGVKSSADTAVNGSSISTQKKKTFGKPIVIVPQSFTALLNSTNVEDFLVNSKYTTVEDKRAVGAQRAAMQTLSRPMKSTGGVIVSSMSNARGGGKTIDHMDFKVVDNPVKSLKEDEWDNVVAVFATGQTWQFKGWKKGYDTPVDLFSKVLGIHLVLQGAPIDPNIEQWNCKVLKVHQYERQQDNIVVRSFWSLFDNFLKVERTEQAKYLGLL